MKSNASKLLFMISSAVALFIALILFTVLMLSSLQKQYYEDAFSLESFVSSRFAEKLSRSAKYGIPPHRMANLELFVETYQAQSQAYSVLVLDKNADILASCYYDKEAFILPDTYDNASRGLVYFQDADTIWLIQPIVGQKKSLFTHNADGEIVKNSDKINELNHILLANHLLSDDNTIEGYVVHGIKQGVFFATMKRLIFSNLYTILIVSAIALILLCLLTYGVDNSARVQQNPRKKIYMYASLVVPLVLAQMIFTLTLYTPMKSMQEKNIKNIAGQLCMQVANELEFLHTLNVSLEEVADAKIYFLELMKHFEWLSVLEIHDQDVELSLVNPLVSQGLNNQEQEKTLAMLTNREATSHPLIASAPIASFGIVTAYISQQSIQDNMLDILIDIMTVMVITFVFLIEFISIIFISEETRKDNKSTCAGTVKKTIFDNVQIVRPIAFCSFFCVFLASSFISLRMAQISPSLFGLSKEITLSLPVSIEMFFVGCSIFLGGFWANRIGWRNMLITGCILVACGNFISALINDPLLFIASRCIAGFGYGFTNLSLQLFVLEKTKPEQRTQNLASMVAGCYAGLLCTSAFGGLLADRLGFASTFYIASVLMLVLALFLAMFLPKSQKRVPNICKTGDIEAREVCAQQVETTQKKEQEAGLFDVQKPMEQMSKPAQSSSSWRALWNFVTNIPMAGLLFMNIVPCAFVSVCIFNYYIPVSLNSSGASPADIGRVSMFLSLMIVYLGPFLGRLIDKSAHERNTEKVSMIVFWLFFAGILGALSVFTLSFSSSVLTAIASVVLLGLSNAIVFSAQGAYVLGLPIAKTLDNGKVVAIYNIAERLGQVLGPLCLGILLSLIGTTHSLHLIAITFVCMSILLVLSALYKK